MSLGSCRSRRIREGRSTCGSRGRGRSRWSQGRRSNYRSRRCCESHGINRIYRSCRSWWCGRSKKLEHCQGLHSSDSRGDPALELAVFECTRIERVETKLSDRLPPESFGKRTQQHLHPLILNHHAALGDYSTDVVVHAKERLQGLRIISTSKLCTKILQTLTCVDRGIGPAIVMPNRIQHLLLECSPVSAPITTHHHDRLSDPFRAVVGKHDDDVSAGRIRSSEGGNALILVEKCRHIRAKKDRRAWTKQKWHLIPVFCRSRDGLNM